MLKTDNIDPLCFHLMSLSDKERTAFLVETIKDYIQGAIRLDPDVPQALVNAEVRAGLELIGRRFFELAIEQYGVAGNA